MNKFKINFLVVAVALLMPCLAFALPGAHDPASGRGYTCNSCHTSNATVGNKDSGITGFSTNICLRCHAPGGGLSGHASSKFQAEDFANPFGTTAIVQSTKIQTSHKWFGADVVPAAGAVAPVDTAINGLNKNINFKGTLFCARCHNVHGTSGVTSLISPYLRYPNDQDQMCFNCHAPRNTTNHRLGTHPVNITYTSATAKLKIASGSLRAAPLVNATNPTGQVKLINGKIVCSTCHGVHGTDSRSSTFDTTSTSTFVQLSSSKGYLLRVDAYGKTANDVNICTNCHAQKKNHNLLGRLGTKPVQCNDCHSGHVEYDPIAVGAETIKNNNLIRRYLQYSSAGRKSKRIFYRYTGATTKEFTNATGKGVCQGCHNLPTAGADNHFATGGTPPLIPDNDHKDCSSCHTHGQSAGSFSYGASDNCLSACHGWPPVNNNTSGVGSRTAGYVGYNETTTPHASHAAGGAYYNFDCKQCHKGYTMPQTPSTTQSFYREVFINATGTGIYSGIRTTPTYSATLNLTPSACNNVYCHSRGNSGALLWKAGQNNITWGENKKDTIIGLAAATRCNTCHDTAMATGAHTKHLTAGFGYGCVSCHNDTVSDNTTLKDAARLEVGRHVNGVRNVEFNGVSPSIGTTCATVACHSNGKGAAPVELPVWGTATTGQCGDCHKTKSFGNLSTGGHKTAAHVTTNDTECVKCHTYNGETAAPHVNGILFADIKYGATGCAANACHGTITAPVWTASYTGKDVCTKCHGTLTNTGVITPAAENRYLVAPSDAVATDTGKVSSNVKIGAHQTHMRYFNGFTNYSTVDYYCQACHGTLPGAGTHADGTSSPNTKFQTLASNWGARTGATAPTFSGTTCSNTYCHNPSGAGGTLDVGDAGSDPSPDWNQPTYIDDGGKNQANCGKCHKVPGDIGFVKQTAHGSNVTNSGYNCAGCHGHNGDTAGALGQRHMDGKFYGSGACNSCHGYPPVKSTVGLNITNNFLHAKIETFNSGYAGGGGYHEKHLLPTIVETDGFAPCLPCHPDSSAGNHQQAGTVIRGNIQVNAAADTSYRFDSTRSKGYNSTAWTCSNVSCHFRPTPAWNL